MQDSPSTAETIAAFELSAALLERLGGPHGLSARLIRERLSRLAAARNLHRNAAIVALRTGWLAPLSNAAAATEITKRVRRYLTSVWKRRDKFAPAVPSSYLGTPAELLFKIVAFSDERPPGTSMIRRILDEAKTAKIEPLESGARFLLESRPNLKGETVHQDFQAIATLKTMPGFREAEQRATEAEIAARRTHLAAIDRLDADATKAYARQEKRVETAIAKTRAVERELKTATTEALAVQHAVGQERFAYQRERAEHETALLQFDQSPITEFELACFDELERVRKAGQSRESVNVNARTGRADRAVVSNAKSLNARLYAVAASMRQAPELRLIADPRDLPAPIAEMKANRPKIEDLGIGEAAS